MRSCIPQKQPPARIAFWVFAIACPPWEPMTFPRLHSGDDL
jgi:hypothetical protein